MGQKLEKLQKELEKMTYMKPTTSKKTVLGERKLKKLQKELEKITYEAEKAILNTKRK